MKRKGLYEGYFTGFTIMMLFWLWAIIENDFLMIKYGFIKGFFAYTHKETVDLGIAFGVLLVSMPILLAVGYLGLKSIKEDSKKYKYFMLGGSVLLFVGSLVVSIVDAATMVNRNYAIALIIFTVVNAVTQLEAKKKIQEG